MEEMLTIRSWKHYWNDFIVKGLQEHVSVEDIHKNIVEAMRKEVFGQLMFRAKVSDINDIHETPENVAIVESLAKSTGQKLNALIRECRKYKETKDILHENDLRGMFPFPEAEEEEEDVEEVDERTAEWPELSEETREENTQFNEGTESTSEN